MSFYKTRKLFKVTFTIALLFLTLLVLGACGSSAEESGAEVKNQDTSKEEIGTITFANPDWDSIRFHNSIARTIIEEGYGYETEQVLGAEAIAFKGLTTGDMDVYMEIWTGNIINEYNRALENKEFIEVGVNYDDNKQGFYVPTYVIEGDPERGIEPMAPDLETVEDLAKYPELFNHTVYGAVTGWSAEDAMLGKMESYGLNEDFEYLPPGAATTLSAGIKSAIDKGEPWVGYNWEPSYVTGKFDMTLLKEPEYTEERWKDGYKAAFPSQRLTIAVSNDFAELAPELVDFLKNYKTSSALTSEGQAYMQDHEADSDEAAIWWMRKHKDLWTTWVPEDVAEKVLAAIEK